MNCFHLSKSSFNFGFTNSSSVALVTSSCVVNCFHLSKSSFNFGFTNSHSRKIKAFTQVVNCFHLSKSSFNFGFTNSMWLVACGNTVVVNCFHLSKSSFNFGFTNSVTGLKRTVCKALGSVVQELKNRTQADFCSGIFYFYFSDSSKKASIAVEVVLQILF